MSDNVIPITRAMVPSKKALEKRVGLLRLSWHNLPSPSLEHLEKALDALKRNALEEVYFHVVLAESYLILK